MEDNLDWRLWNTQNDLVLVDHWRMNGSHYSKTLEAWLKRMDNNTTNVRKVMERSYGKDAADQQIFNWRLFFMFCAEVFGYSDGNEWLVSFHLFKKRPTSSL